MTWASRYRVEGAFRAYWRILGRSEVWPITVILLVLGVLLLGPALWGPRIFLPADLIYTNTVWQPYAPAGYRGPGNGLLSDLFYLVYPWRSFIQQALRQYGELPLWNPYIFGGQPLLANGQSALFYPLNGLSLITSPGAFFAWAGLLRLWLAGLFMYLFLRANGAGKPASLIAGVAYPLCGPMIVWLSYPMPDIYLWLVATLWALQRAFTSPRPLHWLALAAVFVGLQGLAGHTQTFFHTMVLTAAYAGFKLLRMRRPDRNWVALGVALALGVGVMLTTIQILPFAKYLAGSGTLAAGGRTSVRAGDTWLYSPHVGPNLAAIIALILPDAFGNPAQTDYYWPFGVYQNYNEQTTYVGTLPLLLALVVLGRPRRREHWFFLALALVALGVASRLPLFEAVNHLPVFSLVLNKRLRMAFSFALVVLAGWGADRLLSGEPGDPETGRLARRVLVVSLGLTAIIASWFVFVQGLRSGTIQVGWSPWLVKQFLNIYRWDRFRTYLPVIAALASAAALWLYARRRLLQRGLAVAMVALTAGELFVYAYGYCPLVPARDLYPDTPALAYLRSQPQPTRVLAVQGSMPFNSGMITGIAEIDGYDLPVSLRLANLFKRLGGVDIHRQRWQPDWPLLDICGVQYVIGASDLPADRYELVYDREVRIHRLRDALPRAFAVERVERVDGPDQALEHLLSRPFDHRRVALVEARPEQLPTTVFAPATELQITRYEPNRVQVQARFPETGFLVLGDAYDDDWRARIDSRLTPIYPTDYLLRGVLVPAGEHSIEFSYEPWTYRVGGIVSLAALALVIAAFWFAWRQRHQAV